MARGVHAKPTVDDNMLVQAMRERVLDEIKRRHSEGSAQGHVINNYGSPHAGAQGIMGALGGENSHGSEDPRDDPEYFVDIMRENLDPNDPKKGWSKKVHRYVKKKVTDQ